MWPSLYHEGVQARGEFVRRDYHICAMYRLIFHDVFVFVLWMTIIVEKAYPCRPAHGENTHRSTLLYIPALKRAMRSTKGLDDGEE